MKHPKIKKKDYKSIFTLQLILCQKRRNGLSHHWKEKSTCQQLSPLRAEFNTCRRYIGPHCDAKLLCRQQAAALLPSPHTLKQRRDLTGDQKCYKAIPGSTRDQLWLKVHWQEKEHKPVAVCVLDRSPRQQTVTWRFQSWRRQRGRTSRGTHSRTCRQNIRPADHDVDSRRTVSCEWTSPHWSRSTSGEHRRS